MNKDNLYYKLKKRLEYSEDWSQGFLDTESSIEITRTARIEFGRERPLFHWIFNIINFPILCLTYIQRVLIWNSYYKCQKEIKIIRKKLKKYD